MIEIYKQFKSPYVGIWLFWRPALVINDPEIAKRILVKDGDLWRDRFLSSGSSDPIGKLNLFTVNVSISSCFIYMLLYFINEIIGDYFYL